MLWTRRGTLFGLIAAGLSACAPSKFRRYDGPEVTRIEVHKSARKMYLLNDKKVLKKYDIGLGAAPVGHKQFEGDGKTPEGVYYVDRRNPNSNFHLSVGISYPNPADRAFAQAQGKSPGGDIFIHGQPNVLPFGRVPGDWTDGCVALSNTEMEELWVAIPDGTPIEIRP